MGPSLGAAINNELNSLAAKVKYACSCYGQVVQVSPILRRKLNGVVTM